MQGTLSEQGNLECTRTRNLEFARKSVVYKEAWSLQGNIESTGNLGRTRKLGVYKGNLEFPLKLQVNAGKCLL